MKQIITISREYGAGGHTIAQKVAESLGIPYYDKDIVRETAKASGFDLELVQSEGEEVTRTNSILRSICSASSGYFHDTQDAIHDVQQAVILRLVSQGPCIILGRCADEILRINGIDSLNVFIYADELHRAVRVSEITGEKNATELQKIMAKHDGSRRTYYTHYTGKRWGEVSNYHLALDSGALGYDLCAKFIIEAAQTME